MIIYIDISRIKWISIAKNIKPTRGFMKPTALVTSIIFNISIKRSLAQSISRRPKTPSLLLHVSLSLMHLSLQIKCIFFKICKFSARCTGSNWGDFFILFLNILKDIAFNTAITIKKVFLYESSEKIIADPVTSSFTEVRKLFLHWSIILILQ